MFVLQLRHISNEARFSRLIGFYHHSKCEVTGALSVISEGEAAAGLTQEAG